MKISKQAQRNARELFRACLANGVLDEPRVRQAVAQLLAQKPRGYLQVLTRLAHLVKLDLERHSARVECAAPLPADWQARLKERLEKIYGTGLNTVFSTDPSLIGGLRIQVGSDLYDGSVKTKLAQLAANF
ncbi:MAG: F0F1 ATP synthase subunit delta [Verrucomicrobiota bacterium]|jgi:F-type H+-transporting ATPase subunit delta